jgi:PAS domain S-box-containing protein
MTSQQRQPTPSNMKRNECVLLIASDADAAARVLGELGSVTEERFEVEWVTELSRGIERLCDGGVRAVVLDLNLPDSKGVETFDKLFQAAPGVPILILSDADTEEEARQAVQHGAQDHLLKEQADGYRLRRTVRTMMNRWAEQAVSRENALATITLDSIGEGVVRTDLCGNVTYLNGFAEKMSGWFREEALGRPVADVLRLVDSASGAVLRNVVVIVTQGDKSAMTTTKCTNCTLIRRDGLEFGIENRVAIIHDQDGDTIGAVISPRQQNLWVVSGSGSRPSVWYRAISIAS